MKPLEEISCSFYFKLVSKQIDNSHQIILYIALLIIVILIIKLNYPIGYLKSISTFYSGLQLENSKLIDLVPKGKYAKDITQYQD